MKAPIFFVLFHKSSTGVNCVNDLSLKSESRFTLAMIVFFPNVILMWFSIEGNKWKNYKCKLVNISQLRNL